MSTNLPQPSSLPTMDAKHDYRRIWLVVLVCLGLLGVFTYWLKSEDVFPSASIDLRLNQKRVQELAKYWADVAGYKKSNVKVSTIFDYDNEAKTFLEYELGSKKANQLMKDELPVWYWTTRMCQPLQLSQFLCQISPSGKLVAFVHHQPNDYAIASIAHSEALTLAQQFVETKVGISLAQFTKIKDGKVSLAKRTDHFFTWENKQQSYGGARLRINVNVSGNQVSGFDNYLYVPESWERKFSKLRSYNELLTDIASVFLSILNVSTFFIFLWAFTQGLIRWRFALFTATFITVISCLESLNSLPRVIHSYATSMPFDTYLIDYYVSVATNAVTVFIQAVVLAGAAEALYRLIYPKQIALEHLFTKVSLATKQTMQGLIAGQALFGIHLGWVVAYYLFGRQFGFWSPLDVQNAETLSSYVPAISASYIGCWAAFSEEFAYRILGTTILTKLVRHFWLANLLQAAAWAFMHSNYAQEPPYARGLELTVVGLIYGAVLKYFGILPCLVSHYVFDTFLGVVPLFDSTMPYLKVQAVLVVVPFALLIPIGFYLLKKRPADMSKLENASVPRQSREAILNEILPHTNYHYLPLSKAVRTTLVILLAIFSIIQFGFFPNIVGKDARLTLGRDQAIAIGRLYLINRHVNLAGRSAVAWVSDDYVGQELQYAMEKVKFQKALELSKQVYRGIVWKVRFYRPLDPQIFQVTIDNKGHVSSFSIALDEEATGEKLTEDEAKELANNYLKSEQAKFLPLTLKDIFNQNRTKRTDYNLKFSSERLSLPNAQFNVNVSCLGNVVCNFSKGWQLPDQWLFEKAKRKIKDQIAQYLNIGLNLIIAIAVIWWLKGLAATQHIHWRPAVILAIPVTLCLIPQILNEWPELFASYDTTSSVGTFLTGQVVRQVLTIVSWLALTTAAAAFALAAFRIFSPQMPVSTIIKAAVTEEPSDTPNNKANLWLDAILIGLAFGIGSQALDVLRVYFESLVSPSIFMAPIDSFTKLANVASPSLETLTDAFVTGIFSVLSAASLAGLYARYVERRVTFVVIWLFGSVILNLTYRYWQDITIGSVTYFIYGIALWFLIAKLAKTNVLAYFLIGAVYMLANSLRLLIAFAPDYYANEIAILALVLASPVIYLIAYTWRKPKSRQMPVEPPKPEPQ